MSLLKAFPKSPIAQLVTPTIWGTCAFVTLYVLYRVCVSTSSAIKCLAAVWVLQPRSSYISEVSVAEATEGEDLHTSTDMLAARGRGNGCLQVCEKNWNICRSSSAFAPRRQGRGGLYTLTSVPWANCAVVHIR